MKKNNLTKASEIFSTVQHRPNDTYSSIRFFLSFKDHSFLVWGFDLYITIIFLAHSKALLFFFETS